MLKLTHSYTVHWFRHSMPGWLTDNF